MIKWQNIEDVYVQEHLLIEKNSKLFIEIILSGEVDDYDKNTLPHLIKTWTYAYKDKNVRPFRMKSFSLIEKGFNFCIEVEKKSKQIDELKLLCQDLVQLYNMQHMQVKKLRVEIVDEFENNN